MNDDLHILILEDDPTDLELIQTLLVREMGKLRFTVAGNKEEYIRSLDLAQPDVILADHSLPGFNATQALFQLQKKKYQIPFILVTGTVSEEFAAVIMKLGAADYVLKDRPARLPAAIDSAIMQNLAAKEKKQALDNLILSEERYRTLIERITDGFIALDTSWRYTYMNEKAGQLAKRDPKSMIGKNVWEEFPDAVGSDTYLAFHQALKEQRFISKIDYYAPHSLWQENNIYPSTEGISVFIRDITNRKKADDDILQANRELHELSSHLQTIREQERIRISREIHDELGQQLTGLKMDMHWLQKQIPDENTLVKEKISGIVTLIDETVKSVRRIAADLRPSMLDDLGLIAALEWHAQETGRRSEIDISFHSPLQLIQLPVDMTTGIFRIYQELLTNAIRHAGARHIDSSLRSENGWLLLQVKDDGRGMDPLASASVKTLGWVGIKERTHILGGTVDFFTEKGKGTEVLVSVPYQETTT